MSVAGVTSKLSVIKRPIYFWWFVFPTSISKSLPYQVSVGSNLDKLYVLAFKEESPVLVNSLGFIFITVVVSKGVVIIGVITSDTKLL